MTESVWDYLRPPRVEPTPRRIRVLHGGVTIADSTSAFRVLETSHPPRDPMRGFEVLRDAVALYAQLLDECWVDDERVHPQEGTFSGGWITKDLVGPFKGSGDNGVVRTLPSSSI